jgi:hypothetical protein
MSFSLPGRKVQQTELPQHRAPDKASKIAARGAIRITKDSGMVIAPR